MNNQLVYLVWEKDEDHRYLMGVFNSKEKAEGFIKEILWRAVEGYEITQWEVL